MRSAAAKSTSPGLPDATTRITDFLHGFSVEATHPKPADLAGFQEVAPKGTRVYLSAIPTRPSMELVGQSVAVRAAGFEPVPHIAVRNFTSKDELSELLARLSADAAVRELLIIAGDRNDIAGPFSASI